MLRFNHKAGLAIFMWVAAILVVLLASLTITHLQAKEFTSFWVKSTSL